MVHRVEKYADGGKVIMPPRNPPKPRPMPRPEAGPKPKRIGKKYADGGKVSQKFHKPRPRDTVASPKPVGPADAIRNQRKRQEQLLGLKDGGKVRRR